MEKITLCGDDCLQCPRYLAQTDAALDHVRELWHRIGMSDRLLTREEIRCTGCSSHKTCTYQLVDCTKEHGVEKCNQCGIFPCEKIKTMLARSKEYEQACQGLCTKDEYAMIAGAFFHKIENLKK